MVTEEKYCRICNGELKQVWNFGEIYSSDFVSTQENLTKSPLVLAKCSKCELVQLKHTVELDSMFKTQYWYRSGLNRSMLDDLKDIVRDVESKIRLHPGDVIVDIGTNDGSLFDFYREKELVRIGFDPAKNIVDSASDKCTYFINDYFNQDYYNFFLGDKKAKVVTAIAMFYDLPDPNKFLQDVRNILRNDGIFVIQLTNLYNMLSTNAIDNLCFEHLEYYSLRNLMDLFENNGMYIYRVSYNKVNGGSIRVFSRKKTGIDFTSHISVYQALAEEKKFYQSDKGSIESFIQRVDIANKKILSFIEKFLEYNIYALGASTKGNTLLQLFNLDNTKIKAIGEVNKDKFGLFTVGTNIPIISEDEVLSSKPDLIIILPWHFISTFSNKLKEYVENGGLVLFPLPEPYVLTSNGGFYL